MDTTNRNEPPDQFDNFLQGLDRALSIPKTEIDKREKEWTETEHKRGRPKARPITLPIHD